MNTISVIIPAKDEAKRLPDFLNELSAHCGKSNNHYEIIVIDDGSIDATSEKVLEFKNRFEKLRLIQNKQNRGKGFAVRRGLMEADGDIVLFIDADGATPADEIERHLHYFSKGYDIVIGSRELNDNHIRRHIKLYRKLIGRFFHLIIRLLLRLPYYDTQCGFKMFTRQAVRDISPLLSINGFAFDLDVLVLAHKLNFKVKETAVSWKHVPDSHINFFIDPLKMVADIFTIRRKL